MNSRVVEIAVQRIVDWESFHEVFRKALGFPSFYGCNMDAWIDCMTSVDSVGDGLATVTVQPGEMLVLKIDDAFGFRQRCPEQYNALVECSAFVNFRREEVGEGPVLAILFSGRPEASPA